MSKKQAVVGNFVPLIVPSDIFSTKAKMASVVPLEGMKPCCSSLIIVLVTIWLCKRVCMIHSRIFPSAERSEMGL